MDLHPGIGNPFRTTKARHLISIIRCTNQIMAATEADRHKASIIHNNTKVALRPTIRPIISSEGARRRDTEGHPLASTRAKATTILHSNSRIPTYSTTSSTGQVNIIQATIINRTMEGIIIGRINNNRVGNTTTRPLIITTTRITIMAAHRISHLNSNRIKALIRQGVPLMWRSPMKTWMPNLRSCRTIRLMWGILSFWWRSSCRRRKLWPSRIRHSRRLLVQSLDRITTTSMNRAESLMFTVRLLKCICASSKNWRRRQALWEHGRISSAYAMIVRRSGTKL